MPRSPTHNELLFRPPPGVRFTIWGADVMLQFERGREREIFEWFAKWNQEQVFPLVQQGEAYLANRGKVAPANSGIKDLKVATTFVNPEAAADVTESTQCPMGCGIITNALGIKQSNINPACAVHGNPNALYGKIAKADSDTDPSPDSSEGEQGASDENKP